MNLPEIPAEVLEMVKHEDRSVEDWIVAAWPHLYAAALRHAADELTATSEIDLDVAALNGSYWRGRITSVTHLRRLADEATRP